MAGFFPSLVPVMSHPNRDIMVSGGCLVLRDIRGSVSSLASLAIPSQ